MSQFKTDMQAILTYCERIENQKHHDKFIHFLHWTQNELHLVPCFEWHMPVFADNNLIVGFSAENSGIWVHVDGKALDKFINEINKCSYQLDGKIMLIKWTQKIDFDLLTKIINFEKAVSNHRKHLLKLIPLEIKYSNDSWPNGPGLANFNIKYDSDLNAYVGSNWFGESVISVDEIINVIKKYQLNTWKASYYEFSNWEVNILDGSWWHLDIVYEKTKLSSRGGCEFEPKFLERFESEMQNLFWKSIATQRPDAIDIPTIGFHRQKFSIEMGFMPLKIIVNYNTPFPSRDGLHLEIELDQQANTFTGTFLTQYGKYNIRANADEVSGIIKKYQLDQWKTTYIPDEITLDRSDYWDITIYYETDEISIIGDSKHHPKKFHQFKSELLDLAEENVMSTENSYFFENPHSALLFSMIKDKFTE